MKLTEKTFAVRAEREGSISHKWFKDNASEYINWHYIGQYYAYVKDVSPYFTILGTKEEVYDRYPGITIYAESVFESLLKKEKDRYYYKKVKGALIEQCKVMCDGTRIGGYGCARCAHNKGRNMDEGWIMCERISEATKQVVTEQIIPPTESKQITISYKLAIEYIAERLNVDKGIIKIENGKIR